MNRKNDTTMKPAQLTPDEQQRYARSIMVDGFTAEHQAMLRRASITVVGAGGLGSAVLSYLAAAGVGSITVIEHDTVNLSNLQRQILYSSSDIGHSKAAAAHGRLAGLNPEITVDTVADALTADNADELLACTDIVVDCTDNYRTRYVMDAVCSKLAIPLVYGTAQEWSGQVAVFNFGGAGSYAELFPEPQAQKDAVGVISPVVGIIGSLQATEAIKLITGLGKPLTGTLLTVDARTMSFGRFEF